LHIRWLLKKDVPVVMAIEQASFVYPWAMHDMTRCLKEPRCFGKVAVEGDQVIGYMVYDLSPGRIQLLNLAVACDCRRQGVGRAMIDHLKHKLGCYNTKRTVLGATVWERNLPGQLFFRACGFRAVAIIRNTWSEEPETAGYLMEYSTICRRFFQRATEPRQRGVS